MNGSPAVINYSPASLCISSPLETIHNSPVFFLIDDVPSSSLPLRLGTFAGFASRSRTPAACEYCSEAGACDGQERKRWQAPNVIRRMGLVIRDEREESVGRKAGVHQLELARR